MSVEVIPSSWSAPRTPGRSNAEESLVERTAALLHAHGEHELADAVGSSRLKLFPWRPGPRRYRHRNVQVRAVLTGPAQAWSHVALPAGEVDHLLRAELAQALGPWHFPRSVEIQAQAA